MSYCQLIFFKNGRPNDSIEYRNSHGGAAFVWSNLYDKYLKDPNKPYDNWLSRGIEDRSLWDLAKNQEIPLFMRAVHASMFDYAIVRQEHFAVYAKHLEEFVNYFGTQDFECHLLSWAQVIKDSKAEAIGFYGTSVAENLWYSWDEEKDKSIPYNLKKGKKHFEVYDWLNQWAEYYNEQSES